MSILSAAIAGAGKEETAAAAAPAAGGGGTRPPSSRLDGRGGVGSVGCRAQHRKRHSAAGRALHNGWREAAEQPRDP